MNNEKRSGAVNLRLMTFSDVGAVLRIEQDSFPTPWPRGAFLYDLARPGRSICRVAEITLADARCEVVGDIVIWLSGNIAHVATLAVHPAYRRRGVGGYLLADALLKCVDRGMTESLLEVREQNRSAQKLYRKFGFVVSGSRKGYYRDTGEDAVVMVLKPLAPVKLAEFVKCG